MKYGEELLQKVVALAHKASEAIQEDFEITLKGKDFPVTRGEER